MEQDKTCTDYDKDLSKISNFLKENSNFYQAEVTRMSKVFHKFGLLNDNDELDPELDEELEQLARIQERLGVENLNPTTVNLSSQLNDQNQQKINHLATQLDSTSKTFAQLNRRHETILSDLERIHDKCQSAVNSILSVSNADRQVISEKIKQYERQLEHFQMKHEWLKDDRLKLTSIEKETQKLTDLKRQQESLEADLAKYEGLKPDLDEATKQLEVLKLEYQKTNQKLMNPKHFPLQQR